MGRLLPNRVSLPGERLVGLFDDGLCHCLFHEVDLTLTDQLHVGVSQRNQNFLLLLARCPPPTTAGHAAQLLRRGKDEEGVRLHTEVKVLCKAGCQQEMCVCFQLEQVVLRLPYKRHQFEFSQVLLAGGGPVLLRRHKVENQLLAPLNHALDHVEAQHAQRVQDVDALVQQWRLDLALGVNLAQHVRKLMNLRKAGFASNNCSDRRLNRRLLRLKVVDFFHENMAVLLGRQAIDTVEENSSVVVRDQIGLPRLQQLLL